LSSSMVPPPPPSTLFPYTTLFRSPRTSWRGWTRRTARTSPHAPGSPSSASSRSWRRSHDRSARLGLPVPDVAGGVGGEHALDERSEEHTSELQSRENLVCRLLLEK